MATKTPTALRNEAETLHQRAAELLAKRAELLVKRDELLTAAEAQEAMQHLPIDTPIKATRRDGSVVDALYKGAKDTERGILVAVQVGEGFDAEVLRLPLSKVEISAAEQEQAAE